MKKGLSLLLCLAIILSSTTICFGASVKKPTLKSADVLYEMEYGCSNTIGLYWKWDKKNSGYDVYAAHNNSKYSKVGTVKKQKVQTMRLSEGGKGKIVFRYDAPKKQGTYKFKVKAYKIIKGKKHYSSFSNAKSVPLQSNYPNFSARNYFKNWDNTFDLTIWNWYHTHDVEIDLTSIYFYDITKNQVVCGATPLCYNLNLTGNKQFTDAALYTGTFGIKSGNVCYLTFKANKNNVFTNPDLDSMKYEVYYNFTYNGKTYKACSSLAKSVYFTPDAYSTCGFDFYEY